MKLIILALVPVLAGLFIDFDLPETFAHNSSPNKLVVHEWGTFTSVAGKNGVAIDWRPLNGTSDLPTFVYKENDEKGFRGTYEEKRSGKSQILVKVRMETPVIYFYTDKETEVDVQVDFPRGRITEWYPQAAIVNNYAGQNQRNKFTSNTVNWSTIKLLPNEKPDFLRESADSHYYPARETDAVPVQVCNADKTLIEKEKFLFYRGIGNFQLPLKVILKDKKIVLNTLEIGFGSQYKGKFELTDLMIFEKRGDRIGFRFVPKVSTETIFERPELSSNLPEVFGELEKILVRQGLYKKEAEAMLETWKDSWFEEGLRVFYVLPHETTDEILPLQIAPRPQKTVRVLVGRAEVVTPEMEQDVRRQVGFLRSNSPETRAEAQNYLQKYGRFYEPVLRSLLQSERDIKVRRQIQKLISVN